VCVCHCQASSEANYGPVGFQEKFEFRSPETQAKYQIYTLLVTLGIAIVSGWVVGVLMKLLPESAVRIELKPFSSPSH
jgi:hypothetical protein